jgi:hypothetical protein
MIREFPRYNQCWMNYRNWLSKSMIREGINRRAVELIFAIERKKNAKSSLCKKSEKRQSSV